MSTGSLFDLRRVWFLTAPTHYYYLSTHRTVSGNWAGNRWRYPFWSTLGLPIGRYRNSRSTRFSSLRINRSDPQGNPFSTFRRSLTISSSEPPSANHADQSPIGSIVSSSRSLSLILYLLAHHNGLPHSTTDNFLTASPSWPSPDFVQHTLSHSISNAHPELRKSNTPASPHFYLVLLAVLIQPIQAGSPVIVCKNTSSRRFPRWVMWWGNPRKYSSGLSRHSVRIGETLEKG